MEELIRRCFFRPYRKGAGPVFTLNLYDRNRIVGGRRRLSYRLYIQEPNNGTRILFEGDDFGPSPMNADDSDETVKALMMFLTLRPGDTDSEYFERYTEEQKHFCAQYAEDLALEVYNRMTPRVKCGQCGQSIVESEAIYDGENGVYFCDFACCRLWSSENE